MLTINCLFLSRVHDRNNNNKKKCKNTTKDLKGPENLHKHAQAAIIPTNADAFKLQIYAQKRRLALCC